VVVPERALRTAGADPDPFVMFSRWYDDALAHGVRQPDAMVVATATADARPSARAVLLRGVDERGFCFFTNFGSRKGTELDDNPRAAIVFHWPDVQRQVRVTGTVDRVGADENDAYWRNRPRGSRISAWASAQSVPVGSRAELEAAAEAVAARFGDGDVPRPEFWGGYRVIPDELEFWQHREDRLHDRVRYSRGAGGSWVLERLQP
jgi:pyridoxamine 5'-phosphate oxidase